MNQKLVKWGVLAFMLGMFLVVSIPVRAQVSGAHAFRHYYRRAGRGCSECENHDHKRCYKHSS